jgi:hypothetical protein
MSDDKSKPLKSSIQKMSYNAAPEVQVRQRVAGKENPIEQKAYNSKPLVVERRKIEENK